MPAKKNTINDNLIQEPIAVIGMGCRFPGGASNPDRFWKLLISGENAVIDVPEERWNFKKFYDKDPEKPGKMYVRKGAFLQEPIDEFDSNFFGVSPRESATYDPQQRLLLEVSWEAMENAGVDPDKLAGSDTGVFIGAFMVDNLMTQINVDNYNNIGPHTATCFTMTMLSNRISYAYDLCGPSFTIDTACSSSLVATHQACRAIHNGECSMALAGGVAVDLRPEPFIVLCKAQMLATDGCSKSFDERADGYGRGEGAGVVLLKSLSDAIRDKDPIQSVILATGVNQDGQTKGISVPNPEAQIKLIRQVCERADIEPSQIQYIEAHGTGTPLGDPIEAKALGKTIGAGRKDSPCTMGSAKATVGHTEAAAGVVGLIKSTLCLENYKVPPQANLQNPNPNIPFAELGLKLPRQVENLNKSEEPIYVGINSFGYGGTNSFVILSDKPQSLIRKPSQIKTKESYPYLLLLSARDPQALRELTKNILSQLDSDNPPDLNNLVWTMAHRRSHHTHRLTVSGWNEQEIIGKLSELVAEDSVAFSFVQPINKELRKKTVFVCSGMGPQWWKMGQELYQSENIYRDWTKQCDELFRQISGWSIAEEMLKSEADSQINRTQIAQPANFLLQVGLALVWRARGVVADAYVGHSVGEVSSAYLAGVLDLKSALLVSYHRSRIQSKAASIGGMLAVGLSEEAIQNYLSIHRDLVSIAAINGASAVTLAGDSQALASIAEQLSAEDIFNRELQVEIAYHSPTMDPLYDETIECLKELKPQTPHTPLYSTVSGQLAKISDYDSQYWFENIRKPVKFMHAINQIIDDGYNIFVEIGPHPVLSQNIKECVAEKDIDGSVISSLNRKLAEQQSMIAGIADYYTAGGTINYKGLYPQGQFVTFPCYPWQRTKQWLESESSVNHRLAPCLHPLLQQKTNEPNTTFETRINSNYQNYVYDHKIKELVVLPAAGYVEMALAVAKIHLEYDSCILEELSFKQALVIDLDDEPRLRLDFDEQSLEYKIYSSTDKNPKKWIFNSEGRFSQLTTSATAEFNKEDLEKRCNQSLTPQEFYKILAERGQNYGAYFQGVTELKYNNKEFFSKVEIAEDLDVEGYSLHPCILDSAFQTFLVVLSDNVYMPVNISRLEFIRKPQGVVWVYGIVKQRDKYQAQGDITLFDEQGRVLVHVQNIICQAISRDQAEADQFTQLSYGVQWQVLPAIEPQPVNKAIKCLVMIDDNTVCQNFCQVLNEQKSIHIIQVKSGIAFKKHSRGYFVNANESADIKKVVDAAVSQGCDQLFYLWDIKSDKDSIGYDASTRLLQVIKVLAKSNVKVKLTLVTQNGQMVSASQSLLELSQSASIGLARVAANELPDLRIRMIDLDCNTKANQAQLIKVLFNTSGDNEIAIRGDQVYVSRLNNKPLLDLDYQKRKSIASDDFKFEIEIVSQETKIYSRKILEFPLNENDVKVNISALKLDLHMHDRGFFEACGVVSEVGEKVKKYHVGDAIIGFFPGEASSKIIISEEAMSIVDKPENISPVDMLKSFSNYVNCFYILKRINNTNYKRSVLIHEVDNLLSHAAVNVALYLGFEVFVTTNDESLTTYFQSRGVTAIFNSHTQEFIDGVRHATAGQGVDLVLNTFDNELRVKSFALLKPFGHFVEFRDSKTSSSAQLPLSVFEKNINVSILDNNIIRKLDSAEIESIKTLVVNCISSGELEILAQQKTYSPTDLETYSERELDTQKNKEIIVDMTADKMTCLLPNYIQNPIKAKNASYLVTGGLGGFGFETARWLVEQGAKYLILVSRKGATTPETQDCVNTLELMGCHILAIAADISDENSVSRMFAQISDNSPPLHGIIHSAAVLDDDHIIDLDKKRMAMVMQPKAKGAWLLHQYTRELKLDFFVLYSSMSSLIGNPRQGNYVAANSFLDNLAHYRQQMGLAATSVNWGAIGSVGMAARNKNTEKFLEKMGIYSFSPSDALQHLTRILQEQPVQIALMDIDWTKWAMVQPDGHIALRVRHLVADNNSAEGTDNSKMAEILALATDEEKLSRVVLVLTEIMSHILGLPLDKVYTNISLTSMGVDSLLSMEFKAKIKSEFGIGISLLELLKSDHLIEIAQCILNIVKDGNEDVKSSSKTIQHIDTDNPIERRPSDSNILPASFSQQRLWFIDQLQGGSAEYHISETLEITGECDIDAAEKAMNRIIARHETLRTVFTTDTASTEILKDSQTINLSEENVDVMQMIRPEFDFTISRHDLTHLAPIDKADQVSDLIKQDKIKTFDLSQDLMIRVTYLKLSDNQQKGEDNLSKDIVLFNMHHIASDGLSIGILIQEFVAQYQSIIDETTNPLQPLAINYADYSYWQRQKLTGELLRQKLEYWKNQLDGISPVHNLPLDYPRPEIKSHQGEMVTSQLDSEWINQLQAIAKQYQLTPFMLFHGVFALLLSRHSNQSEFVIGTPVANRTQAELKPLIGMFVNTLVLRVNTDYENLSEYLAHIREINLDAQEHQDIPFEQLVEHCNVPRSTKHTSLFQVMFTADSYKLNELVLPDVSFKPLENTEVMAKFDLHLNIEIEESGLSLTWIYDPSLFSCARIETLAQHMNQLLMSVTQNPQAKMHDLSMLSLQETQHLIHKLNNKSVSHPRPQNEFIHTLFEAQVKRVPHKTAIEYEGQQLSYNNLNKAANRLAYYLREQGLTKGDCVGVSGNRSLSLLVSLLGIMKAGGVYVIFDPKHPCDRLSHIVEEANIKTVLAMQADWGNLQSLAIELIATDEAGNDEKWLQNYSNSNPNVSIEQNDLLYVLYTSGSTGLPKGVKVSHLNVLDYCLYAQTHYYDNNDSSLLITSPLFDISVPSLYLPLLSGGKVDLLDNDDPLSALVSKLKQVEYQKYLLRLTPMHVQALLSLLSEAVLPGEHTFVVGGEKFMPSDAQMLQRCFPKSQLYNHYGPTETTVGCSLFDITKVASKLSQYQHLPIGTPMENTLLFVLDGQKKLSPIGAVGELYIGGLGISQGYLNNHELTKQSFIDNPFGSDTEECLYKTGDLVHYLADGNLAFVGRADDQAKIRGYRIEIGEIENILNRFDQVTVGVVLATEDEPGRQQLVAYVVAKENLPMKRQYFAQELRKGLSQKLPNYMVPAVVIILDAMPITANGKIDKQALPAVEFDSLQDEHVVPESKIEHSLRMTWSKLLKLESETISVTTSFFEIGGHSLLAVRLVAEIRKQFKQELTIKDIFNLLTIRALAQQIDLGSKQPARSSVIAVERQPEEAVLSSFSQQRLWLIDQLQGGSIEYNMPAALQIEGKFEIEIAEQVLCRIIDRHETLRTVFKSEGEHTLQIVRTIYDFKIRQHDVSHLDQQSQQLFIQNITKQHSLQAFDLSRDLMLKVSYIHLATELDESGSNSKRGVILFNMHHIASDGWSKNILFKEFTTLYHSITQSNSPEAKLKLPVLDIQYADYALWQRQWLVGDIFDSQLSYWQKQLKDAPVVHSLPMDFKRPQLKMYQGALVVSHLESNLTSKLKNVCEQYQLTPFMLLHGALALVLSKHSNSYDIMLGSPVANRTQAELEFLIGFFVNTLVLRTNTQFDNLSEYFSHIKKVNLDAQLHQDISFEQLVESCHVTRSTQHSPLFQITFTMNNDKQQELSLPGITLTPLENAPVIAKFDLEVTAQITGTEIIISWLYDRSLFKASRIENLSEHLNQLLNSIAETPVAKISSLPMLLENEKHFLLHKLNQTQAKYPKDKLIHELFEAQVQRYPQKIAIAFENQQLTYTALNKSANQLAHYLRIKGVKEGSYVGICVERGLDMLVSILAVLKAGAIYVPLDSNYPEARLKFICQDTQLKYLISQSAIQKAFSFCEDIKSISLDDERLSQEINACSSDNLSGLLDGIDNPLAYVIYTSGSTGQPKGVLVEHSCIAAFTGKNQYLDIDNTDAVLALSSIVFDGSIFDLFVPLVHGKTSVIMRQDNITNFAEWRRSIHQRGVDTVFMTTALFNQVSVDAIDVLLSFKQVLFGGEMADPQCIGNFLKKAAETASRVQLKHVYGPTETTVYATCALLTLDNYNAAPIGRPISNYQAYVLNDKLELLPFGTTGELFIGGAGLARGYLNQPALTAEKFIQNPINNDSKDRLYKTGDLARYLPNGDLVFMGRIDNQVKIRGFRIEPGEIENVLSQCESVALSLVLTIEKNGEKRLIAYVLAKKNHESKNRLNTLKTIASKTSIKGELISQIKSFLQNRLPQYMLPSAIIILEKFPLTANNKIDKNSLPHPDEALLHVDYQAPQSQTEKTLTDILGKLLKLNSDSISTTDNFFELGGHSLLAVRLIAEIRSAFHKELPIKAIFDSVNLSVMASTIDSSKSTSLKYSVKPIARQQNKTMISSFAQQRIWFIDKLQGSSAEYNIFSAFRVDGCFNIEAAEQAICRIIERHESLRTSFDAQAGFSADPSRVDTIQLIQSEFNFKVTQHDLTHLDSLSQQNRVNELMDSDKQNSFDLRQDLLLRVSYIKLTAESAVVLFNIHHIVFDGWSIGVLLKEFMLQYQAILNNKSSPFTSLAVQYADYAYAQRTWLVDKVLEEQLSYWTKQLIEVPMTHGLTLDYPRPEIKAHKGARVTNQLDSRLTQGLLEVANQQQVTPFMLLHGVLALVLARHSNRQDIVLGTPVANRMQVELEEMIGCFVNTLVLRVDTGQTNIDDYFAHIKQINLEAQAHQDIPFEQLVEHCNITRSKQHSPLFQIMFMMDTTEQVELTLPEVNFTPLENDVPVAKFDLEINASMTPSGIKFCWVYDTSLFKQAHIETLSEHLNNLLVGILEAPNAKLSQLPMMSKSETNHLIYDCNSTQFDYQRDKCIHEIFEAQVTRLPNAIALKFDNQQITYKELNQNSNKMAHYLIQHHKILPDTLVGICLERSINMVTAILAILKAGAAYVPIDPLYPQARVNFILDDAKLNVVISQSKLLSILDFDTCHVISADSEKFVSQSKDYCNENPATSLIQLTPSNLAYVIYTSGSTGTSKGVMIEHRSVINYLSHVKNEYLHREVVGSVVSSSLSFDATVTSILSPLVDGKYVELLRDDNELLPELFKRLTSSTQPLLFKLTPSHLLALSKSKVTKKSQVSHRVIVGGEQLTDSVLSNWRTSILKNSIFINEYGPTETTVGCAIFKTSSSNITFPSDGVIPIGRAIGNTQLYVLNEQMKLVPKGVSGELYIGGDGLARGYLNQSQLTSARFIDNPLYEPGQNNSKRLYRTGDQVRYLSDGNLIFVGRLDDQVKIRGYRIELGEIEYQLNRNDNVDSVLVLALDTATGSQQLVAYVKPKIFSEKFLMADLKQHLSQSLPEYMIPSIFIMIDEWPLTTNGKIDKTALPAVDSSLQADEFHEPKSDTEIRLAYLWSKLLHKKEIGIHDNFFSLGGHSLLIMQMIASIKHIFDLELATDFIFERATIVELATAIDDAIALGTQKISLPAKVLDLHAESVLPERFKNIQGEEQVQVKKVLLTGATGFLGAFILGDLLKKTQFSIACLVRAKNKSSGMQRIKTILLQYKLWQEEFSSRIEVFTGDLSQNKLGLSESDWAYLAENIDAIYHNGALVNFLYNYHSLKKANVDSSLDIVSLAISKKLKHVHYVSTLSVFSSVDTATTACKETTLPSGIGLERGYAQSKWVAEHLLLKAKQQGLPLSIYRPGRITGDSVHGISNTDDFFSQMLRGCYELDIDSYPNNVYLDMTPVDYVSQAIVYLSQKKQSDCQIYHLFNPISNDAALFETIQNRGNHLQACDFSQWQKLVKLRLSKLPDDRLAAFNVVLNMKPEDVSKKDVNFKPYDCYLTTNTLATADIVCPPIDHQLCELYLDYMASIDIVPKRKIVSV